MSVPDAPGLPVVWATDDSRLGLGEHYDFDFDYRESLAEWLKSEGVNPNVAQIKRPTLQVVMTDGGYAVRFHEPVLTGDGRSQWDPENPDVVWTRARLHLVRSLPPVT